MVDQFPTGRVLVVRANAIAAAGWRDQFTTDIAKYLPVILNQRQIQLVEREVAEHNVRYKQLIPYVVMRAGELLFCYRRPSATREARLQGLWSLGVGGHIEESDVAHEWGWATYQAAMRREVNEEVIVETDYSDRVVALINDTSTSVGAVHLGVLHIWDLQKPAVQPRGDELSDAKFRPWHEVKARVNEYEHWSQIAIGILESHPPDSHER